MVLKFTPPVVSAPPVTASVDVGPVATALRPTPSTAIFRGLARRCPNCGERPAFRSYLKQVTVCPGCGAALGEISADDIPPYFTILLVGHLVIPALLIVEQRYEPPEWLEMAFWPSFTLLLTLVLLPYIKGGVLGLMWSLRMRGDEQR